MATNKRKLTTRTHKTSGRVASIYRLPDTREYLVQFEGNPAADYHTDCQNDAYGTAERWAQGEGR
jgi:hypothetical protein